MCERQWEYLVYLGQQPELAFVSVLQLTVDMPFRRCNKPYTYLRLCVCGLRSDKACETKVDAYHACGRTSKRVSPLPALLPSACR
jgi:hypothetical protein